MTSSPRDARNPSPGSAAGSCGRRTGTLARYHPAATPETRLFSPPRKETAAIFDLPLKRRIPDRLGHGGGEYQYAVWLGEELVVKSRDPEFAACRALAKSGRFGLARFWREGKRPSRHPDGHCKGREMADGGNTQGRTTFRPVHGVSSRAAAGAAAIKFHLLNHSSGQRGGRQRGDVAQAKPGSG